MSLKWMLPGLLAVAGTLVLRPAGAQEAPSAAEQQARQVVSSLHWRDG
jgi:hypothetical protein